MFPHAEEKGNQPRKIHPGSSYSPKSIQGSLKVWCLVVCGGYDNTCRVELPFLPFLFLRPISGMLVRCLYAVSTRSTPPRWMESTLRVTAVRIRIEEFLGRGEGWKEYGFWRDACGVVEGAVCSGRVLWEERSKRIQKG